MNKHDNNVENEDLWWQLVMRDKNSLSGYSVFDFSRKLVSLTDVGVVIARDVVGAGPMLADYQNVPMKVEDFLARVKQTDQYDWAYFFLFPQGWPMIERAVDADKEMIRLADVTIRLADSNFFYIYSRNNELIEKLRDILDGPAVITKSAFSQLNVPF